MATATAEEGCQCGFCHGLTEYRTSGNAHSATLMPKKRFLRASGKTRVSYYY